MLDAAAASPFDLKHLIDFANSRLILELSAFKLRIRLFRSPLSSSSSTLYSTPSYSYTSMSGKGKTTKSLAQSGGAKRHRLLLRETIRTFLS
jgi:hypothetical protein